MRARLALLGALAAACAAPGASPERAAVRPELARRVAVDRYGTQFVPRDGELVAHELEDPARVDEWRAAVGLGTLAEYAARVKGR